MSLGSVGHSVKWKCGVLWSKNKERSSMKDTKYKATCFGNVYV